MGFLTKAMWNQPSLTKYKLAYTHTTHTHEQVCVDTHIHTHTSCRAIPDWWQTSLHLDSKNWGPLEFLVRPHLGAEGREVTNISLVPESLVGNSLTLNHFHFLVQTMLILTSVILLMLSPWHGLFFYSLFTWVASTLLLRSAFQVSDVTVSRAIPDMLPHPRAGLVSSSVLA